MTRPLEISSERLAAYLDDEVDASERAAIERALQDEAGIRQRLAELRQIANVLSSPVAQVEDVDLRSRVQAALAHRSVAVTERRAHWPWSIVAVATAACVALAVGWPRQGPAPEFRAKSLHGPTAAARQWAGVQIHRAVSDTEVKRVASSVARHDRLLFSYTNLGAQPFDFLMVFAVDVAGRVYWFYPSYDDFGENPASAKIAAGGSQPLPDLIEHDYALGQLTVYALFTRQPLHVLQVEEWLREDPAGFSARVPSEAHLQTEVLQVSE